MAHRGHIKNGVVAPDEPLPWPEGTEVTIEAVGGQAGSANKTKDHAESPAGDRQDATPKNLLPLVGLFPPNDLKEIEEAVRDCRKVDMDGW